MEVATSARDLPLSSRTETRTRVLVTGANGFIGNALCRYLIKDGNRVIGFVRPTSNCRSLDGLREIELATGDITVLETLISAMRNVEVVYHVAGLVADWGPWSAFKAANIEGVRTVMEAALAAGVRRVVHVSSVSVYGFPGGRDIKEDAAFTPRPGDPYVTSKAAGERAAMRYHANGLEVAVIRPAGVYGAGDRTTTEPLAQTLEAGKFAFIDGGRHIMAPIYIDSLVNMIHRAGTSERAAGEAFNGVDEGYTDWHSYISWMCEELGIATPRLSLPRAVGWAAACMTEAGAKLVNKKTSPPINRYRLRAVMQDNHYSIEKAKRLLGWRPLVSTREGITSAIDWYRRDRAERGVHT